MLREVGEQDKWKGIILTQGRGKGCWEPTCWERQRNHQGTLKHWLILLRSSHWFLNLFILFFVAVWRACVHSGTCWLSLCLSCWVWIAEEGNCDWHSNHWRSCCDCYFTPLFPKFIIHSPFCIAMFLSLQTLKGADVTHVTHNRFKLSPQFIIFLQLPKPTFKIGLFSDKGNISHRLPTGISCKLFSFILQISLSQIKLHGLYLTLGAKWHIMTSVIAIFRLTQLAFSLCK